jgi:hypothetical protein
MPACSISIFRYCYWNAVLRARGAGVPGTRVDGPTRIPAVPAVHTPPLLDPRSPVRTSPDTFALPHALGHADDPTAGGRGA